MPHKEYSLVRFGGTGVVYETSERSFFDRFINAHLELELVIVVVSEYKPII